MYADVTLNTFLNLPRSYTDWTLSEKKKKRRIGLETRKLKILKTAENDRSGSWTVLKDQVTNLTISENGKKQVEN